MKEFEFVLNFELPDPETDPTDHLDALFEAGCDDALVGVGARGCVSLDFSREAESAQQAMLSAIEDVQNAIPGVRLAEVSPDLVNTSEIAELLDCSRQLIRKYVVGEVAQDHAVFPPPVKSGTAPLWHFSTVIDWMTNHGGSKIVNHMEAEAFSNVADVAKTAKAINLAKERLQDNDPTVSKAMKLIRQAFV